MDTTPTPTPRTPTPPTPPPAPTLPNNFTLKAQRAAAAAFVERWAARPGYEKGETAPFWLDFLATCLNITDPNAIAKFEQHTDAGFPDVTIADASLIIEQKSSHIDLDKPETRQNRPVTPYQPALSYAQSLPPSQSPRYIITCNFATFRIYDREIDQSGKTFNEIKLSELPAHIHLFNFITDPANSRIQREKQISMEAGAVIGTLHTALMSRYLNPDSPESQHALNVLCVRLVFCLFADDAGLFGMKGVFSTYVKSLPADHLRDALLKLFAVLDTPEDQRDPYLSDSLKAFPYVNGGLFDEVTEVPTFTEDISFRLFRAARETDWENISPTIFGGLFESTLNPITRKSGGMHYTSTENIHKVIDPLFLDNLESEYAQTITSSVSVATKRKRLLAFQEKLASLTFLDPACGSGNFLTETYICLRRLENKILIQLEQSQSESGEANSDPVRVSLSQFYGIEINDFAVRVAKTALWIAELQANIELEDTTRYDIEEFPLTDSASITLGNALTRDWNEVLPARQCTYIMGNPPFIGASHNTTEQKEQIVNLFGKIRLSNSLDYVAGWYCQACDYMSSVKTNSVGDDALQRPAIASGNGFHLIHAALVSTNSIIQGEQVHPLWHTLKERFNIEIDFAWRTFIWNSEATDKAHVHCVIIAFHTGAENERKLPKQIFAGGEVIDAVNINPYLIDALFATVQSRSKPLCDIPKMTLGNKPADGGFLIMTDEEKNRLLVQELSAQCYIRRYIGAEEYLNNKVRWCLWFEDADAPRLRSMPKIMERLQGVKDFRLKSTAAPTRAMAEKPYAFFFVSQPTSNYIIVPSTSSERRVYVPIGFLSPSVIASNSTTIIPDATLYHFGILTSQFHNAWMRVVAGRLKSDYRYSGSVVYNTFPWPETTDEQKQEIERLAQAILNARANYPDSSLADLYDPLTMPSDLRRAHKALDQAVESAYKVNFHGNEPAIISHLFRLYFEMVSDTKI
jgi:hypothetical protein